MIEINHHSQADIEAPATSPARFRRDQNKATEARDLLAPVNGWLAEAFDTLDLKGAKVLLRELS